MCEIPEICLYIKPTVKRILILLGILMLIRVNPLLAQEKASSLATNKDYNIISRTIVPVMSVPTSTGKIGHCISISKTL